MYKWHGNYKLQILSNDCLWREERKEGNETGEEYPGILKFYLKCLILKLKVNMAQS